MQELDKAWKSCFKKQAKAPRWKKKENAKSLGLTEPHPKSWSLIDGSIKFPKLGKIRAIIHRPVSGNPKTCTLRCEAGQWFASLIYEQEVEELTPRPGPVIAIDRGITHLLADSDGRLVDNPRYYEKSMKQLARAQRAVSRKKKGSKNRDKAKMKVARLHRKTRRQRAHYLHVESARYAKSHGKVVLEALNVQGMVRNKSLSRYIADAGWSIFANMLDYKLKWFGGELIKVPPHYSSQTCSECGAVDAASRSGVRFCCTSCSHRDHADLNAAKVLKTRMNRSGQPVKGSCQWTPHRSRKVGSGQQSLAI